MIASAFGISAGSRYVFPTLQAADDVTSVRPAVVGQVGGAAGAFDFYGAYRYPLGAVVYTKKFTLSGANYAAVETALQSARAYTIADTAPTSRAYLYGTQRGGTAHAFYTPAKCISFKAPEQAGRNYTTLPIELQFQLPQPWWYGAAGTTTLIANSAGTVFANGGNLITPVKVVVTRLTGSNITAVAVANTTTGESWTYTSGTGFSTALTVDAGLYEAKIVTTGCYSDLTFGTTQMSWLSLAPGNNTLTLAVTGGTTWSAVFTWSELWSL